MLPKGTLDTYTVRVKQQADGISLSKDGGQHLVASDNAEIAENKREGPAPADTWLHKTYAVVKQILPNPIAGFLRRVATAILTPLYFSYQSGHFQSSLRMRAMSKSKRALPWYTYPCIDFLRFSSFEGCDILEFGGGQSTLFWAERARSVCTFEGDPTWYSDLKSKVPDNVFLKLISMVSPATTCDEIRDTLQTRQKEFDVIIVDGLYRSEITPLTVDYLASDGMIIVDDSEGYDSFEGLKETSLMRVDFYGHQPGVILPHCTSIWFGPSCKFLSNRSRIQVASKNH